MPSAALLRRDPGCDALAGYGSWLRGRASSCAWAAGRARGEGILWYRAADFTWQHFLSRAREAGRRGKTGAEASWARVHGAGSGRGPTGARAQRTPMARGTTRHKGTGGRCLGLCALRSSGFSEKTLGARAQRPSHLAATFAPARVRGPRMRQCSSQAKTKKRNEQVNSGQHQTPTPASVASLWWKGVVGVRDIHPEIAERSLGT